MGDKGRRFRLIPVAVTGAALAVMALGGITISGVANASPAHSGQGHWTYSHGAVFTEVDNGTEFAVSTSPDLADTSASAATYSDAGVVVNVGTIGSLSASRIAFKGSSGLLENVWIGNGPQASTPGIYPLSSVDFCYGLGSSTGYYMTGANCGSYLDQTLTLAQITADFPANLEAYAWVGVTSSGSAVPALTVYRVDGQEVGLTVGVLASGGVLTPYVS